VSGCGFLIDMERKLLKFFRSLAKNDDIGLQKDREPSPRKISGVGVQRQPHTAHPGTACKRQTNQNASCRNRAYGSENKSEYIKSSKLSFFDKETLTFRTSPDQYP
jgi:hypothetical protein